MKFRDRTCRVLLLSVIAAVTPSWAYAEGTSVVRNPQSVVVSGPPACPVHVMEPVVEPGAFQGNAGGHVSEITKILADRILAVARERCPSAQLVQWRTESALLEPTIVQWKQMRTDDPIGAFILPHNSIVIRLQLMRAEAPASNRTVTFRNRARFTLNQPAERLLNDAFNKTVRLLLSPDAP